jgi:hypothetical protein
MKLPRRNFLHLAAGAAALPAMSRVARAQTYASRPVRAVVAFAPGGVTDTFARLMAQKLTEQLGKQVYVENIAGASGNLGTGQVEGGGRRLLDPVCVQLPCGQPDAWLRADRSQCRNNEQVHGGGPHRALSSAYRGSSHSEGRSGPLEWVQINFGIWCCCRIE